MRYDKVVEARFIERKNRFIAECEINGKVESVHIRNTGRCGELFVPDARVYLEPAPAEALRSTRWSLVSVERNGRIFNVDSSAPNRLFKEAVEEGSLVLPGIGDVQQVKGEVGFGSSRLDFFIKGSLRDAFAEVKGVTLEQNGVARFPDAPTERGIKHLNELTHAVDSGYAAFAVFIIKFQGARSFSPNWDTHPEFGFALKKAREHGVEIIAVECCVVPDEICCDKTVFVEI